MSSENLFFIKIRESAIILSIVPTRELRQNLLKYFVFIWFPFQERKESGKRGRKPGRKASTEKIDMKAKLGECYQPIRLNRS